MVMFKPGQYAGVYYTFKSLDYPKMATGLMMRSISRTEQTIT